MRATLGQIAALARLRPFDTGTEEGRARERYRRVLLTTGATVSARGLQALFSLMTVPLALHHYGAERYGLWLAISSFLTILVFVDQGLGAGLVQSVATAEGRGDEPAAREWITAAFVIVGGFGLVTIATLAAVYPLVPWPGLFRVQSARAAAEAGPAMAVLVVGFMASAVLGLVQRVYQGRQAGFVNNAWQVLGSALALLGVWVATRRGLGVPWLVAVLVGGPALASAASGVVLFGFQCPGLRPAPRHARRDRIRALLRMSAALLLAQLATAATLAVDNVIVAQSFGAAAVPGYAVPARLFYFVQMLVALVPQALWPAYSEAIARGDAAWASRAYRRATAWVIAGSGAAGLLLVVGGPAILRVWVGDAVTASLPLLVGLAAALVTGSLGVNVTLFLTSTGRLRAQLWLAVALLASSTPIKVLAVGQWGVAAIPATLAACTALALLLPGAWLITKRRSPRGAAGARLAGGGPPC